MTERLDWFPCNPTKLLGALAAMKPTVGYVYVIVLLRIYEVGGPCPDTLEALCRRTGYNRRIVSDALDALFRAAKLQRTAAGIINPIAADVLAEQTAIHQERVRAGRAGGTRAAEKRKGNQTPPPSRATAKPQPSNTHLNLEQDSLFPSGNRALKPAPDEPIDIRTDLFRRGLSILARITGKPVDKCRPLIGGWLKQRNDDAVAVLRAIEDAERNRVADPIPWVKRALQVRDGPRFTGNGAASLMARMIRDEQQQREERNGENAKVVDVGRALPAGRTG